VPGYELIKGLTKSCGCLQQINISAGDTFNRWTAIKQVGKNKQGYFQWNCLCSCGEYGIIAAHKLFHKKSSGCKRCSGNRRLPKGESAFNSIICIYKHRANKLGLCFKISKKRFKILVSACCFYCGSAPANVMDSRNGTYTYNGLDRLNNNLGYTYKNCVTCCKRCNTAKMTSSFEDFLFWIEKVELHTRTLRKGNKHV
jgi:hypothetical protein